MLRVKIICTIGPASRDLETLTQIAEAGMNVARLNMSHGTHEYHNGTIERIRTVSERVDKPIAILADLQGPKLRVGVMQEGGVLLKAGDELILTTEEIIGEPGRVPVQYVDMPSVVSPGERILLDDGMLELEVLDAAETEIRTKVIIGGVLNDKKGVNLPDGSLNIPAITQKDIEDVRFALAHQADWIALSFVRTAAEVIELKKIIEEYSTFGRAAPVIAKIEKPEALLNIDDIIAAADGIMIARGDLGIETSPEKVPTMQKTIISKCHHMARPVITATQMLDSMIRNPRPTRAEASDVANAVLDGSDAIMLSGETASGSYPVESVRTMAKIAREAERLRQETSMHIRYEQPDIYSSAGAICSAAMHTAKSVNAKAIVAPTISGATARFIAAFRPNVPVIAVTPSPMVQRRLCLYWGLYPLLTRRLSNTDEVVTEAINVTQKHGYVGEGETVVLTAGVVGSVRGATNLMMVRTIEEVLATGNGVGQRELAGKLVNVDGGACADDLVVGPQDIVYTRSLDRSCLRVIQRAGGLITGEAGSDSPGALAAVELGIPAIIGIGDAIDNLADGQLVIMDTMNGQIIKWNK